MDDDAERGIIFVLGVAAGLLVMWLVFTSRGRQAAQQVFEAAENLAGDLAEEAGEMIEAVEEVVGDAVGDAGKTARKARKRFLF